MWLRKSTASQARMIGPFVDDTDFKTPKTGLTIANTDVKISLNGAAGASKNSGGGTHRNNGDYSFSFDATDTGTVGEFSVTIVVASALPVKAKFWVLEQAVYDELVAASAIGYIVDQPVNATKLGGTSQTGRDIGASVLLSAGSGAGQLDFTAGVVKANLAQILATALTETAGQLAGGFKKFFNIAAPASTMDVLARVTLVDTVTAYTGNTPQTGDSYARIGAAGVGLTNLGDARIANLDATISSRTKPADTQAAVTLVATTTNLTNAPTAGDLTAAMKTSVTTAATAATPALSAAGVTAIWNEVLDGVFTARQLMRGFASVLLGLCSGMATATGIFRDISNTKDRLTVTQDASGNRSAITRDLT